VAKKPEVQMQPSFGLVWFGYSFASSVRYFSNTTFYYS